MKELAPLAAWIVCFTALNVLLKRGVDHLSLADGVWPLLRVVATSPWAYLAIALYVSCAAFYLLALRLMPLSVAGPIYMTLGVCCAALTGLFYFGEPLQATKLLGIVLCVAGIVLLTVNNATA